MWCVMCVVCVRAFSVVCVCVGGVYVVYMLGVCDVWCLCDMWCGVHVTCVYGVCGMCVWCVSQRSNSGVIPVVLGTR